MENTNIGKKILKELALFLKKEEYTVSINLYDEVIKLLIYLNKVNLEEHGLTKYFHKLVFDLKLFNKKLNLNELFAYRNIVIFLKSDKVVNIKLYNLLISITKNMIKYNLDKNMLITYYIITLHKLQLHSNNLELKLLLKTYNIKKTVIMTKPVLKEKVISPRSSYNEIKQNEIYSTSGFRASKILSKYINIKGAVLHDQIKRNTTHLIVKNRKGKKPNKIIKAEQLNIKIIDINNLLPEDQMLTLIREATQHNISKPILLDKSCSDIKSGNLGKEVFNAPILLAKDYKIRGYGRSTINPTGWWASEKYDGYRAIWTGKRFLSRNKNQIIVPKWFSALMPPNIALDGELWIGRGLFRKCGMFRRKQACSLDWIDNKVRYKVFDIPSLGEIPFEQRMQKLKLVVEQRNNCFMKLKHRFNVILNYLPLNMTDYTLIKSEAHLDKLFDDIVSKGGEGIMIRQPNSLYEGKRSSTLLKYKVTYDIECKIIGYNNGTGKYDGMLGSFKCKILDGNERSFNVSGMNDDIRVNYKKTHKIGTIITILYNDTLKNGIPRHPRYLRKRDDYKF